MEPWFADAVTIETADVDIFFVIHDDFLFSTHDEPDVIAPRQIVPVRLPEIPRRIPQLISSAEAIGHEDELVEFYAQIIRYGRRFGYSWDELSHYFWLRLFIWNVEAGLNISFPWYDTVGEMTSVLDRIASTTEGNIHWDCDQGWEMNVHAHDGFLFVRQQDPDVGEVYLVARMPRAALAERCRSALERSRAIIGVLADRLGDDVWTSHKYEVHFRKVLLDPARPGLLSRTLRRIGSTCGRFLRSGEPTESAGNSNT